MRNESELLQEFKRGDDNTPSYWRARVTLEVLFDLRTLMTELVKKLS